MCEDLIDHCAARLQDKDHETGHVTRPRRVMKTRKVKVVALHYKALVKNHFGISAVTPPPIEPKNANEAQLRNHADTNSR